MAEVLFCDGHRQAGRCLKAACSHETAAVVLTDDRCRQARQCLQTSTQPCNSGEGRQQSCSELKEGGLGCTTEKGSWTESQQWAARGVLCCTSDANQTKQTAELAQHLLWCVLAFDLPVLGMVVNCCKSNLDQG